MFKVYIFLSLKLHFLVDPAFSGVSRIFLLPTATKKQPTSCPNSCVCLLCSPCYDFSQPNKILLFWTKGSWKMSLATRWLPLAQEKNKKTTVIDQSSVSGWLDGSAANGTCCQVWWLEFHPQSTHGRRELTPINYTLASTCSLSRLSWHANTYVHQQTQQINAILRTYFPT